METIAVKNLTFTYPKKAEPVLKQVEFSISDGQFVTICGKSGCGKSTLLKHFRTALTPTGVGQGDVCFEGTSINTMDLRRQTECIGFVQQSPDNQIVTDKVWHELAFGLESLGYTTREIHSRVAEMASFFGIQTWFHKEVTELSGGQKQLLNLASVMVMQPKVLVLDEPTSRRFSGNNQKIK
ncbi:MAG: ABC transporter ATP-binding protein [Anaerovorax sp.]